MTAKRYIALFLIAALLMTTAGMVMALDLGDILTAFGIAYAVRVFAPQLDSFVSTLLFQRGVEWEDATRVVPIISIGTGAYVGAAQVVGPPERIGQVAAVGQGEIRVGTVRLNGLFPVDTLNPVAGVEQVPGVGVSAIIDFRI